jgi:Spy/CpxP family protein refolding chaperone
VALIALLTSGSSVAQIAGDTHANHSDTQPAKAEGGDLASELQALRLKVGQLEAALKAQHQARYATDGSMPSMSSNKAMGDKSMGGMKGMGSMKSMSQDANDSSESGGMSMGSGGMGMGKMGGMKNMSQDSGSQSSGMGMGMMSKGMGGMGMMSMMKGKKGMMGMGMMGMNPAMQSDSMAWMEMPSALPGFPGASHLYHIGQTGFFLDHPEHITLTDQQQKKLNTIKESSLLATSTAKRKIAEAEQELWVLTAADQPDITKIEAKAKEIASLTVNNRIEFIRAVGNAAEILTEEQRQAFLGSASSGDQ